MIESATSVAGSNLPALAAVVLAFLCGSVVPVHYAAERLRGFGRAGMSRLPYKPPPGMEETEAMEEATDE